MPSYSFSYDFQPSTSRILIPVFGNLLNRCFMLNIPKSKGALVRFLPIDMHFNPLKGYNTPE